MKPTGVYKLLPPCYPVCLTADLSKIGFLFSPQCFLVWDNPVPGSLGLLRLWTCCWKIGQKLWIFTTPSSATFFLCHSKDPCCFVEVFFGLDLFYKKMIVWWSPVSPHYLRCSTIMCTTAHGTKRRFQKLKEINGSSIKIVWVGPRWPGFQYKKINE